MMLHNEVADVELHHFPVLRDSRGWFQEIYRTTGAIPHVDGIAKPGPTFVQDNVSFSQFGVLRGMHLQKRNPQGKLIHCLRGTIFDAWVDLRPKSPSFKKWGACQLQADRGDSVYLPPGLAHGFFVMSDFALVLYKCTTLWDSESDTGIKWSDPNVRIEWPFNTMSPILSDRDRELPSMAEYLKGLESEAEHKE